MTEQIENRHNSERQINWDNYAYTRPIAEALTATFAVPFGNHDMGGRVYVAHDGVLEGGVYLVVGSGFDGYENLHGGLDDGYGVASASWTTRRATLPERSPTMKPRPRRKPL